MKKTAVIFSMALLLLAALSSFQAEAADNVQVLVWSGNGAYHVEVEFLKGNATEWGYDVTTNEEGLVAADLEGIDILIVNAPDYVRTAEVDVIATWFGAEEDRGLWIAGESDYGGYWYPQGLNSTHVGVNHIVIAVGGLSMHGPANVVPYKSYSGTGRNVTGVVAEWDDLDTADWLLKTSTTGSVADQDFDDDAFWEGYPIGENMSLPMAACEWDLGDSNNKLVLTGESMYADYKNMFGPDTRYRNNTLLQNIQMTNNVFDWFAGTLSTGAPGFEIMTVFIALAIIPAVKRRRK
jgi:hypothetical protein